MRLVESSRVSPLGPDSTVLEVLDPGVVPELARLGVDGLRDVLLLAVDHGILQFINTE